MTRTARRKNKKEPLPATPWEDLKVDAIQQTGSDQNKEQGYKVQKLKEVKKGTLKVITEVKKGTLKVTTEAKLRPHLSDRLKKKLRKKTGRNLKRSLSDTIPLLKSSELNDSDGDQTIDNEPLERQKASEKKASAVRSRKRKVKRRLSEDRVPLLHSDSESSLDDEPGDGWPEGGESVDLGGDMAADINEDRKKLQSAKRRKEREEGSSSRDHGEKGGSKAGVADGGSSGVGFGHRGAMDERRRKRIEQRKLRRQRRKVCFNCRQPGHWVSECPLNAASTGICFKCGSADHSCQQCKAKVTAGDFPYAKCFICNEVGHLSRSCPDNPRGLYPRGGGCKICGSVEHFKANCPQKQKSSKQGSVYIGEGHSTTATTSADAEIFAEEGAPKKKKHKQMKERVVKF